MYVAAFAQYFPAGQLAHAVPFFARYCPLEHDTLHCVLAVLPAELVKLPPQAVHVAALAPPVEYVFALQFPVIPCAEVLNPNVPPAQYFPAGQLVQLVPLAAKCFPALHVILHAALDVPAPAAQVKLPPQAVHVAALAPPVEYVFALQFPVIPCAEVLNPNVPPAQYFPAGQLVQLVPLAAKCFPALHVILHAALDVPAPAAQVKLPPQAVHVAALAPPVEYVFALQFPVIP